jgi:putative colanic acid biosynthesis UDP-glucose lipid carrier transferase
MKKLTNTLHDKIVSSSLHSYNFLEEDIDSIDKENFHEGMKLLVINKFKPVSIPLYSRPLEHRFNQVIKRLVDTLIAALVIFFILSWLLPLIALFIKLDSKGPIFFLQKRNKRNGEIFTCIKFRSMFVNAEADLLPAKKNDKRITRVGRFLRKNYLDELPQFFNVLVGDMSVVGPRPHMISDNLRFDELIKYYFQRNKIKPGITGLAQVMGYDGPAFDIEQMQNRVNMDIFYLRHWSLKLDFTILYHTIRKILG